MEQLSVPSMNQLYLGSQALQGLMEGEDSLVCTAQPPLSDVVLSGSPPLPGLSFSTTPHCSATSLLLSFSFSPGPSPRSVQGLSWCQENAHEQAATCTLAIDARSRRQTQKHAETHRRHVRRTHTIRKPRKSFLILSALSSLRHSQSSCPIAQWLPKISVQFTPRRRFGISWSLVMTFKWKVVKENHIWSLMWSKMNCPLPKKSAKDPWFAFVVSNVESFNESFHPPGCCCLVSYKPVRAVRHI